MWLINDNAAFGRVGREKPLLEEFQEIKQRKTWRRKLKSQTLSRKTWFLFT